MYKKETFKKLNANMITESIARRNFKDKIIIDLDEMRKDKSEGSLYYAWQANIAMVFYDEWHRAAEERDYDTAKLDIHAMSNRAAKNFLDNLIIDINE